MELDGVWIVQQDDTPHNTVLGVFATQGEADTYASEVEPMYPNKVIYFYVEIGYRQHSVDFARMFRNSDQS